MPIDALIALVMAHRVLRAQEAAPPTNPVVSASSANFPTFA